ncbi:hypothetical protein GCM10023321_47890 [Pseudonocardia eucalypti]|uniref:Uncharacterized protein n=1 Tax=Pseudonocardia eucalypti TaxID=648755 RepID=A0ABP9QIA3_9PSEU|nr:hypothetical protein [Pseudonocardia eucalypti]
MDVDIPSAEQINAMSTAEYRVYENDIRRMARRHGLELQKSRRRDPRAMDYGKYMLVRVEESPGGDWRSRRLFTYARGLALHEIHRLLTEQDDET